jgi:TatD DNase family protein
VFLLIGQSTGRSFPILLFYFILTTCRICWNEEWSICQAWLDKYTNSVVGITPLVTFPRTVELQMVAKMLPLNRMVLETDAPYLLPRGGSANGYLGHTTREFSLPLHVANVAAQVAAIRDCKVEEVLRASRENIARVYNI